MASLTERIDGILRLVDREIWIVTAAHEDRRGGLTATWVSQASIDSARPLVLIGLAPNHHTAQLVDGSGAFALHLLTSGQTELAWNFARDSGRDRDKFADLTVRPGITGSPLLDPCLAWLECRVFGRLATGDRTYYWADVVAGDRHPQAANDHAVLTEQQLIRQVSDDQRRELKEGRQRDIQLQRPLMEAWRGELPSHLHWRPGEPDAPNDCPG